MANYNNHHNIDDDDDEDPLAFLNNITQDDIVMPREPTEPRVAPLITLFRRYIRTGRIGRMMWNFSYHLCRILELTFWILAEENDPKYVPRRTKSLSDLPQDSETGRRQRLRFTL